MVHSDHRIPRRRRRPVIEVSLGREYGTEAASWRRSHRAGDERDSRAGEPQGDGGGRRNGRARDEGRRVIGCLLEARRKHSRMISATSNGGCRGLGPSACSRRHVGCACGDPCLRQAWNGPGRGFLGCRPEVRDQERTPKTKTKGAQRAESSPPLPKTPGVRPKLTGTAPSRKALKSFGLRR